MNNDDSVRVFRGGCWLSGAPAAVTRTINAPYPRIANYGGCIPSARGGDLGFRLSRIISPLEQISEVLDE